MLDKSISNLIKDVNNIDSFLEKQSQIKPDVGKAGGRFFSVKVAGKPVEFKMKELIADIHATVVKEAKEHPKDFDPKKVSNILKNLKALDNRGYVKVEETHSLIIKLMTTLRQILGNLGFDKKGMLKDLQALSNNKVRFSDKTEEIPSSPTSKKKEDLSTPALKKKEEVETKSAKAKQEPAKVKSLKLNLSEEIKKAGPATWAKREAGEGAKGSHYIYSVDLGVAKAIWGKQPAATANDKKQKLGDVAGKNQIKLRPQPAPQRLKAPREVPASPKKKPLEAAKKQKIADYGKEIVYQKRILVLDQLKILKDVHFVSQLPINVSPKQQLENLAKLKKGLNSIRDELFDRHLQMPYEANVTDKVVKVMVDQMLQGTFDPKKMKLK